MYHIDLARHEFICPCWWHHLPVISLKLFFQTVPGCFTVLKFQKWGNLCSLNEQYHPTQRMTICQKKTAMLESRPQLVTYLYNAHVHIKDTHKIIGHCAKLTLSLIMITISDSSFTLFMLLSCDLPFSLIFFS